MIKFTNSRNQKEKFKRKGVLLNKRTHEAWKITHETWKIAHEYKTSKNKKEEDTLRDRQIQNLDRADSFEISL